MMPQQYCLRWKFHNINFQTTFAQLQEKGCFCDVTLWCGGVATRAHRAVLASCSALLAVLLDAHDGPGEPCLVLDRTEPRHLRHLLSFMYTGEVSVHHTELAGLLKTAEELRVKGLADVSWNTPEGGQPPASEPRAAEAQMVLQPTLIVSPLHNGSIPVPPPPPVVPSIGMEPVKRKRGRPPLEPRSYMHPECDIALPDPVSPKRNKMVLPIAPLKPKVDCIEEATFKEVPIEWKGHTSPALADQEEPPEELSSDYSENSLDGHDISQFLDTTMEEEQVEEQPTQQPAVDPIKVEAATPVEPAAPQEIPPQFADVVKLSDYLVRGRRPQFWAEDYVKRVMEAVFCKELEMKQAAEMLGVSYGTLYGRYRDCFGCINRPYRIRDFWTEQGPAEILMKLQRKEMTVFKAAEMLNVTPQTLTSYLANLPETLSADASSANQDNNIPDDPLANPLTNDQHNDNDSETRDSETEDLKDPQVTSPDIELQLEKSMVKKPINKSTGDTLLKKLIAEPPIDESADELKSEKATKDDVKCIPMIRVANLKFLKGESPGSTGGDSVLSDSTNASSLLKNSHPDITILSTRRKVTFQEIAMSMTKRQVKDQGSPESIS